MTNYYLLISPFYLIQHKFSFFQKNCWSKSGSGSGSSRGQPNLLKIMVLFLWLMVFVVGFAVGALTILGAEAVGVYVFINRLNEKNLKKQAQISQHSSRDLDLHQSLHFASNKQVGTFFFLSFFIHINVFSGQNWWPFHFFCYAILCFDVK